MGGTPSLIGAFIFTALQAIVFLFVVIATPIAMFRGYWGPGCYTLWGAKADCGSTKYIARGIDAFGCGQRRNNMNGGAAFAIVSIVTTLVALICGVSILCKSPCSTLITIIFTALSVATILIAWACVAGVYNNIMCGRNGVPGTRFGYYLRYGAGFDLLVTAWCVEVVNLVILIVISVL